MSWRASCRTTSPSSSTSKAPGARSTTAAPPPEPSPTWFRTPPRNTDGISSGVTVFLTGLSGAGKSTVADALVARLEAEGRKVTVLDGDVVRPHLSSELSFSKEHRDLNIQRIGWVTGEITRHGGTVVVAAIAPYDAAREEARLEVERHGRFVLVHLATSLEVSEQRDVKGLYATAHAGEIPEFTGVSDPYEPPSRAEVVLDTSVVPLAASVSRIRAAMEA